MKKAKQTTAHQAGNRNTVIEDIRCLMADKFAGDDMTAACLFWAKATCLRLEQAGHRAVIQAGSAYWKRVPPELDDGVVSTEYGYRWDVDDPTNMVSLMEGGMPEMHCWAALPDRNQIIDLTTGFQVERCRNLLAMDWPAEHPPDWLWINSQDAAKKGCFYEPCPAAIRIALGMLRISKWGE